MSSYKEYKEKVLKNPEIKAEYDALEAEYDIIQAMIDARNEQDQECVLSLNLFLLQRNNNIIF